jgi:serine/threonine-protein kinase
MPLADGAVFAGYTIVRILGAGGMGEVYLAQHPRLPRLDALKVLGATVSDDDEFRRRFNQEAEMVAALRHPNIVTVFDRGDCDAQLWIAMEFVDGIDAGRLLEGRHPNGIPAADVVRIVASVADALDYAHGRKLLHRDIKPANILLGVPGDDRVMLADFGVARWIDQASDLTGAEMTIGTVAYAAPEQLKGEVIDGRADQYSLAATAFHLLTGAAPFTNTNPAVVIGQHLSADPPAPARSDLSMFVPVFARALAKDPADRFASCRDFAAAMQAASAGGAGRSSRHRRPRPRRRRTIEVALGLSLLAAVAGGAVAVLSHDRGAGVRSRPGTPPPPAVSARMDLPVVVLGADCAVLGAAAVDATGNDAYCARLTSQDSQTVWSPTPERLRNPAPAPPATPGVP